MAAKLLQFCVNPPQLWSACFPFPMFTLLCLPVTGSWQSVESQPVSSVLRQCSLTDLYHSDGLRARFYQSMFTFPRKLYSCSKEPLIYLILIVIFLKYKNLDRHFVYLKYRYLEKKSKCFLLHGGWDINWVACECYWRDSSRSEELTHIGWDKPGLFFPVLLL